MITVVILGSGNVATHLFKALLASKKATVIQWFSRNTAVLNEFKEIVEVTNDLNKLKNAHVYLIAISDDAIEGFSESLPLKNSLVVHTSGSVPMAALSNKNRAGVFYPLQTFSKEREVDFKEVPLCLEAEYTEDLKLLKVIAESISSKVYDINSEQRKSLHLAAVFVNNFVNHLYHVGNDICNENEVPFSILKPLIEETTKKIVSLDPLQAQTGPAKRNDQKTIENHITDLEKSLPQYKELYKIITASISKTYGREKL